MPTPRHGFPDYGQTAGQSVVYPLLDVGEAAARLGSIVTYDRRGDVVWFDDFEHSLRKWESTLGGLGARADISLAIQRHGDFSVLLCSGATDPFFSQIGTRVYLPGLTRCGFEASFAIANLTDRVTLTLVIYTGSRVLWGAVQWAINGQLHQYLDADGVWQTLAINQVPYVGSHAFHTMKLVIDPDSEEYTRILIDGAVYEPATPGVIAADNSTPAQINPFITNIGFTPMTRYVYVDDVIITQNEPAKP